MECKARGQEFSGQKEKLAIEKNNWTKFNKCNKCWICCSNSTNVEFVENNPTNPTDSVNVNVNVNDIKKRERIKRFWKAKIYAPILQKKKGCWTLNKFKTKSEPTPKIQQRNFKRFFLIIGLNPNKTNALRTTKNLWY
jgi:hypothetical protein